MSGVVAGDTQKSIIKISTIFYQVGLTASIASIGFLLFGYLNPRFKVIYNRRYASGLPRKFSRLPSGLTGWIRKVWTEPDESILSKSGLDAFMFIKFIQLNLTYTLFMLVTSLTILIVNLLGRPLEGVNKDGWQNINLSVLTASNIKNSDLLWAHIVAAWFSAAVLTRLFLKNNFLFIQLRQKYFNSREYQSQLHNSTLFLTHIPERLQSDSSLNAFMTNLKLKFPPVFCTIGRRVGHLPQLVREYNASIRQFEVVLARFASSDMTTRPTHHLGRWGWLGQGAQVDSIEFYVNKLTELREEIFELRGISRDSLPVTTVGFVIYPDVYSAHVAARQLGPGPGTKLVERLAGTDSVPNIALSPSPDDLIWSNILLTKQQQFLRWLFFTIIFIGIVIGGAFMFAKLGEISNISLLVNKYPAYATVFTNPSIVSLLDSTLAPGLMLVIIYGVQILLRRLSEAQSAATRSSVERRLLAKFLAFLVCDNLVIFSTLASLPSIKSAVDNLNIYDFQSFVIALKQFVPSYGLPFANDIIMTASFWSSQMCLRTLGYLVQLLQPISLLKYTKATIRDKGSSWIPGLATTSREKRELTYPSPFSFPIGYAIQTFNMTLVMVFGIVAPTIMPFGVLNFSVAYVVYKHQLMYVHANHDEGLDSGGRLYATAFHGILAIWTFSNFFLLLVVLLLGGSPAQWYSILPLPFLLIMFGMAHRAWFDSKLDYVDLSSEHPSSYAPTTQRNIKHRLSARPTGQEVEMTYILPQQAALGLPGSLPGLHSNNSSFSNIGEHVSLTNTSRSNDHPTSTTFSHHPAFDQELLTLECKEELFTIIPELRPFASPSSANIIYDTTDTNNFTINDSDESAYPSKNQDSNYTPHF